MSRTYKDEPYLVKKAREEKRHFNSSHVVKHKIRSIDYTLWFYAHEVSAMQALIAELYNREIQWNTTEIEGFPILRFDYRNTEDGFGVEREPNNCVQLPSFVPQEIRDNMTLNLVDVSDKPVDNSKKNIFHRLDFTVHHDYVVEKPVG